MLRALALSAVLLFGCAPRTPPAPAVEPAGDAGHAGHGGDAGHAGHGGDHATVSHRFEDAAHWSKVFDDPARDAWQKPEELVAALAIPVGATVADIGAGTGYFNRHLARAVGPAGRVIAVDVEPTLVAHMKERALAEGTARVEARLGRLDDPGLTPGEVDLVLLVDTYHHIDGRVAYFTRLREAVKPGGRLVVVDFKAGDLPVGPPPDHRIAQEQVVQELVAAGWTPGAALDLLPYQFVQVMHRP